MGVSAHHFLRTFYVAEVKGLAKNLEKSLTSVPLIEVTRELCQCYTCTLSLACRHSTLALVESCPGQQNWPLRIESFDRHLNNNSETGSKSLQTAHTSALHFRYTLHPDISSLLTKETLSPTYM